MKWIPFAVIVYIILYRAGVNKTPTRPRPAPAWSLWRVLLTWLACPGPIGLLMGLSVAVVLRVAYGGWRPVDGFAVALPIILWPGIEWFAHACTLHRPWLGMRLVYNHHIHHQYPQWPETGITPAYVVWGYLCGAEAAWQWGPPWALTVAITVLGLLVWYEWVHYLIHTDYKVKNKWFIRRKRRHSLHHYYNDRYWYGVTCTGADCIACTDPWPSTVARHTAAKDRA